MPRANAITEKKSPHSNIFYHSFDDLEFWKVFLLFLFNYLLNFGLSSDFVLRFYAILSNFLHFFSLSFGPFLAVLLFVCGN